MTRTALQVASLPTLRGSAVNPFNIFANPWVFFGSLIIMVAVVWYGISSSDSPDGVYVEDACSHASARC